MSFREKKGGFGKKEEKPVVPSISSLLLLLRFINTENVVCKDSNSQ